MAIAEKTVLTETFIAGEDLSSSQYKFVKMSDDMTVIECNALVDIPIGVLQDKPTLGRPALVMVLGRSKVESGAALTAGWLIGTAADGQAVRKQPGTNLTHYIVGHVVHGSGAAARPASAMINCMNPVRAQ